jgi:hypothetical protein
MEWFTKSILPPISKDVAMDGVTIEEKSIMCSQQLDFIYSHLGTLYNIIPNDTRSLIDPINPNPKPHVDGVVGSISNSFVIYLTNQMGHLSISSHP